MSVRSPEKRAADQTTQRCGEAVRVHGPYVSEEEVEQVAADLARQLRPVFVPEVTANASPALLAA